jgi:hypothetical protein
MVRKTAETSFMSARGTHAEEGCQRGLRAGETWSPSHCSRLTPAFFHLRSEVLNLGMSVMRVLETGI